MTGVVTPAVGDLLAERYSLAEHIDDDSSGRQVWRGMDILLNRPVTVVLRTPGGVAAEDMLTAAVAASHVNHPNVVGVYDAVDQGDCAYIVREWVEGQSLRDSLNHQMTSESAVSIMQCVADAVAAIHDSGVAHGNIHPGTILLSNDDRVVVTDPRADSESTKVGDVRAIGASLYCALTGGWPRHIPGSTALPDASLGENGKLIPLEDARHDVPAPLGRLVDSLLDESQTPPTAAQLAGRLDDVLESNETTGALALVTPPTVAVRRPTQPQRLAARQLGIGAAVLVGLALIGLLAALILIPGSDDAPDSASEQTNQNGSNDSDDQNPNDTSIEPKKATLTAADVTIIDFDGQDTKVNQDIDHLVDGDSSTSWATNQYFSENFGNLKDGIGIVLDLGTEQQIVTVQIKMQEPGAELGIYTASKREITSPPNAADALADPVENAPADLNFTVNTNASQTRYLFIWCTNQPMLSSGKGEWAINDIEVYTR